MANNSGAFTHNVMRRYVEKLQEHMEDEYVNAIKASGKVASKQLKPLNHFDKMMVAMGITDPKHDMREFVKVMDAFLPLDGKPGSKDGLLARLRYSSNSKALVAESFMHILQIPEVKEKLFDGLVGTADRVGKLVKLLDDKRKWYLADAKATSRANKKALDSTATNEDGAVSDFSTDGEDDTVDNSVSPVISPVTNVEPQQPGGGSLEVQAVLRELASTQQQLAEVMRELHNVTGEARRAAAEAQTLRHENNMFVHQELNVFKELMFKLIDSLRPAPPTPQ